MRLPTVEEERAYRLGYLAGLKDAKAALNAKLDWMVADRSYEAEQVDTFVTGTCATRSVSCVQKSPS